MTASPRCYKVKCQSEVLVQIGPPGPHCHVHGEGEGPPPHKPLADSQPPMIGNPMCRLKWFYHPYILKGKPRL